MYEIFKNKENDNKIYLNLKIRNKAYCWKQKIKVLLKKVLSILMYKIISFYEIWYYVIFVFYNLTICYTDIKTQAGIKLLKTIHPVSRISGHQQMLKHWG